MEFYLWTLLEEGTTVADDIEYITFDNDVLQTTPANGGTPQTAHITGTVEVDYTTGTVSTVNGANTINVTGTTSPGQSFDSAFGLDNSPLTVGSDGTYQITFPHAGTTQPGLQLTYSGQAPSQASNITYNSDPGQTDNVSYSSIQNNAPLTSSNTAPVCFVTGTRIATAGGPVAVEDLAVGDMALTSAGESRRICWIGHRTIDCRRAARPTEILPIRIAAHAFGADLPARDLVVSPGHAICVDVGGEVLIPAGALVNGTSVVQLEVETVTYWHVELERHEILLAENLPCESYLEMGNRGFFVESGIVDLGAAPDAAIRTHADFCRPFHVTGVMVDVVRRRLATRAAALGRDEAARAAA